MRRVGVLAPVRTEGELYNPVGRLTMLLAEHYGEHPERFRAAARGYVDDRLREVFSASKRSDTVPVGSLLKAHRRTLISRMVRLAGLGAEEAAEILRKLEERAYALKLRVPSATRESALVDLASVAIALAMDFAYTGQFLD
jgi:hypothetical protein